MIKYAVAAVLYFLSITAPLPAAVDEKKVEVLAEAVGAFGGMYLFEAYLTLTEVEKVLETPAADTFKMHLQVQLAYFDLLKDQSNKLQAAFPEDEELQQHSTRMKQAAEALREQNEAIRGFISGDITMKRVREKHAASKTILVRLLSLPNGGKDIP